MQTLSDIRAALEAAHPEVTEIVNGEVVVLSPEARAATLDAWAQAAFEAQAPAPPPPITPRQLRLWLLAQDLLGQVPALINALAEPARTQAEIELEYASEFKADHPLVLQFASALQLTTAQLHDAWRAAALL